MERDGVKTLWKWPLTSDPLLPDYPGSFGSQRKHDIHTGVDLYCNQGTDVVAVEGGEVVKIIWFTGSNVLTLEGEPTSWWNDTMAIFVEGDSGTVLYGEVDSKGINVSVGDRVSQGQRLGQISTPVLKNNKGRPMVMLHLELMVKGSREALWWMDLNEKPPALLDPTPFLRQAAPNVPIFDLKNYDGILFVDPNAPRKESEWWCLWSEGERKNQEIES